MVGGLQYEKATSQSYFIIVVSVVWNKGNQKETIYCLPHIKNVYTSKQEFTCSQLATVIIFYNINQSFRDQLSVISIKNEKKMNVKGEIFGTVTKNDEWYFK